MRMLSRLRLMSSSRSVPRDIESMRPMSINDEIAEEPPDEMKGKGFPVVGNTPMVQPIFRNA